MLEMMNALQSGGSFSGITPPHCSAQDSHFIKVGKCLHFSGIVDNRSFVQQQRYIDLNQ